MQVTDEEIRIKAEEAPRILENLQPLRSDEFIDAICKKIEEELPEVLECGLTNYYVTIEVYDY